MVRPPPHRSIATIPRWVYTDPDFPHQCSEESLGNRRRQPLQIFRTQFPYRGSYFSSPGWHARSHHQDAGQMGVLHLCLVCPDSGRGIGVHTRQLLAPRPSSTLGRWLMPFCPNRHEHLYRKDQSWKPAGECRCSLGGYPGPGKYRGHRYYLDSGGGQVTRCEFVQSEEAKESKPTGCPK